MIPSRSADEVIGLTRLKKSLFFLITAMPSLLLLGIVVLLGRDIYEIRLVTPSAIYHGLQSHLAHEDPENIPLPDAIFSAGDTDKTTVYAFGESSLVLSDGKTFPEYLQQRHADLRVVNFGVSGIDSFVVRQRVEEALSVAKPDVVVLYYGHNDYNNAYQEYIMPNFFQQFDLFLRISYRFHNKNRPPGVLLADNPYWFSRLIRPKFFQFFEQLGMLDIDIRDYEPINQMILDYYVRNNDAIIDMALSQNIPVVLITPVGNLHAEPFGDIHVTTALYKKGMASQDYDDSLKYLKSARDAEIFTYDMRAKSPLIDYIRNYERPGVYVLDLEKKLEQMRFGFGYGEFLDYFHFNDKSHSLLADIIYDFMASKNLVGSGQRRKRELRKSS